jgi:hypothetical protein
MGDLTLGVVLLLVTGFLWMTGAILHWHNIKRQERLLDRMQLLSAPHGRGVRGVRPRQSKAVGPAPDDRLTVGTTRR